VSREDIIISINTIKRSNPTELYESKEITRSNKGGFADKPILKDRKLRGKSCRNDTVWQRCHRAKRISKTEKLTNKQDIKRSELTNKNVGKSKTNKER